MYMQCPVTPCQGTEPLGLRSRQQVSQWAPTPLFLRVANECGIPGLHNCTFLACKPCAGVHMRMRGWTMNLSLLPPLTKWGSCCSACASTSEGLAHHAPSSCSLFACALQVEPRIPPLIWRMPLSQTLFNLLVPAEDSEQVNARAFVRACMLCSSLATLPTASFTVKDWEVGAWAAARPSSHTAQPQHRLRPIWLSPSCALAHAPLLCAKVRQTA